MKYLSLQQGNWEAVSGCWSDARFAFIDLRISSFSNVKWARFEYKSNSMKIENRIRIRINIPILSGNVKSYRARKKRRFASTKLSGLSDDTKISVGSDRLPRNAPIVVNDNHGNGIASFVPAAERSSQWKFIMHTSRQVRANRTAYMHVSRRRRPTQLMPR